MRKHENFAYSYGCRTAPEQWRFYLNQKYIPLDENTAHKLACMCLAGNEKEAEDELKRLLRMEEKQSRIVGKCICSFRKNSDELYFTRQLMYDPNNLKEALACYKKWKKYIQDNKGILDIGYEITEGEFNPFVETEKKKKVVTSVIDLTKYKTINITRDIIFK